MVITARQDGIRLSWMWQRLRSLCWLFLSSCVNPFPLEAFLLKALDAFIDIWHCRFLILILEVWRPNCNLSETKSENSKWEFHLGLESCVPIWKLFFSSKKRFSWLVFLVLPVKSREKKGGAVLIGTAICVPLCSKNPFLISPNRSMAGNFAGLLKSPGPPPPTTFLTCVGYILLLIIHL